MGLLLWWPVIFIWDRLPVNLYKCRLILTEWLFKVIFEINFYDMLMLHFLKMLIKKGLALLLKLKFVYWNKIFFHHNHPKTKFQMFHYIFWEKNVSETSEHYIYKLGSPDHPEESPLNPYFDKCSFTRLTTRRKRTRRSTRCTGRNLLHGAPDKGIPWWRR